MGFDGEKGGIPRVVRDCVAFIRDYGMQEDGLFRRSVREGMLREVKDAYDRGSCASKLTLPVRSLTWLRCRQCRIVGDVWGSTFSCCAA